MGKSVEIFLIANADKWVKGLDRATAKTEEFGRALKNQKKLADMTFKAGAGLVVAAAGMIAATVGPATKLEDAVNRVASLTGKTGAEFTALTAKLTADAKRLASSMGASLDTVTGAYQSAVVNGIDPTTDAFERFVTQALQVSRVTGQDVATNIALADEVLDRFGKKLADSPDALAELYKMSSAAEGGFGPFLQTVGQAGTIAGQLDVPLKEVAATVALMSQQGISGSRAGLALGNMLMRLSGASDNASDSLNKLGIEIIDPTTGKVKNLADIFEQLRTVLGSMSEQEANKLLTELAGGQGVKALGGLLRSTTGDYRSLFAAMEDGKSLQEAFNERTETTKFKIDQATASIEASRAEIGEAYLPILADMATKVATVTSAMSPFITAHADAILPVTGLTLATGLGLMAFGKAAIMIKTLSILLPGLVASFGPFALVVAGVAAALLAVAASSKSFKDKIGGMETALAGNEAQAASLRDRIVELEKEEKTYFETTGKGNPVLASMRSELDELTKTIEKQKTKLAELGATWTQNTVFAIDSAIGTIRVKREELEAEMKVGGWEGGEGAPIFASQIKELEKLTLQTQRLIGLRQELTATAGAAGDVFEDLASTRKEELATGEKNTLTLGDELAKAEALRDVFEDIAATRAIEVEGKWKGTDYQKPSRDMVGPPEPGVGLEKTTEEYLEQFRLVGEGAVTTRELIAVSFARAFEDMAPYALRFSDTFIDTFEMMQAAGKSVFSSLVKSFANAMIEMVKLAIQSAIARIVIEKTAAIAIASIEGFFTFGAALLKIAPIIAIAAGAIAALGGMQKKLAGFATGGIVPKTGMILAHAGERIINPAYNTTKDVVDMLAGTRLAAAVVPATARGGGAAGAPIYFHMPIYGPVSSELDLEKIMRKAADIFRTSANG